MKNILIAIPAFNEENTLSSLIKSIPKSLYKVKKIETLLINDGSTDNTKSVAIENKINHIVNFKINKGLAYVFNETLNFAKKNNSDILVFLDADNQYPPHFINDLIKPIIDDDYDIVIGDRNVQGIVHFSKIKKLVHKIGTNLINNFLNFKVSDPPSGFRAYSKRAIKNLNILSNFTYTIESLFHANYLKLAITEIKIKTNAPTRKSRLFDSNLQYILKSAKTIFDVLIYYKAAFLLNLFSIPCYLFGLILWIRYFFKIIMKMIFLVIYSINSVGGIFLIIGLLMSIASIILNNSHKNQKYLKQEINKKTFENY